ncbi:hypothetical protein [Glycomyces niveus]|uniref:ESX-1 secretion-associated protein n=1 Tax=Glycomyces niveus TaxID=2820287 RepID=A0ABS3TYC0_9ACTN|nr:hypothetical protein [Glycomyces sp. NEAU-S30]MBO3731505.1 hypothetical protein [Glycomyces sp. NEAU-S30]
MVKVDPQALREHAARLANGPMARVKTAADAANTVRLGDVDAYGIVFAQVVPPVLDLFLDDAGAALTSADDLGLGFAEAVNDTAIQHLAADQEVAALFDALGRELDGHTP